MPAQAAASPQADTLAQKVRAKYPGEYDDLSDQELESRITAKYPGVYDDVPKTPAGAPVFHAANATDEAGAAVVDGPMDLIRGVGRSLNPLPTIRAALKVSLPIVTRLADPANTILGRNRAADQHPMSDAAEVVNGILQSHLATARQAWQQGHAGNYFTAIRKAIAAGVPLMGPGVDASIDKIANGQPYAGTGELLGIGVGLFGPGALSKTLPKSIKIPPVLKNANPVEAAAVEFGMQRGVPIDVGTAAGSQFAKNMQKNAASTIGGANIATNAKAAQATELARVGGELANDVHSSPVTPQQAGARLGESTQQLIDTLNQQATSAYDELRKLEADPNNARRVPVTRSPRQERELSAKMAASLGSHAPTPAELQEMRRMLAEMDNLPFVQRTWNEAPMKDGNAAGGDYDIVAGAAGAPVYDDILQHAPGTSAMSRGEVAASIRDALENGRFTNGARGALEVARKRIAGDTSISRPSLPPEAGNPQPARQAMLLPVDLRPSKAAMTDIYNRFKREAELVPLQGAKARAYVALDRLMNGPEFESLSVVDEALSDIKALARQDQGRAKLLVSAIETQVQAAVKRAGPSAQSALERGRSAVKTRVAVEEVLDRLKDEPVKAFDQVTARRDTAIGYLREIEQVAPDVLPQVGRAWLDDALDLATENGRFEHTDRLLANWQKLGPETKQKLFGERVSDLDRFFLLAKRLGENPNPSGTAQVLKANVADLVLGLPSYAIAKILYSPKAARALTRGLEIAYGPGRTSQVMQAQAISRIIEATREVGLDHVLPQAAGQDQEPTTAPRR